jgi:hypothetical protein
MMNQSMIAQPVFVISRLAAAADLISNHLGRVSRHVDKQGHERAVIPLFVIQ